jgi:hypothetical protein
MGMNFLPLRLSRTTTGVLLDGSSKSLFTFSFTVSIWAVLGAGRAKAIRHVTVRAIAKNLIFINAS